MRANTLQDIEGIDAAIFSGDEFLEGDARKELLEYIERWKRQLADNEAPKEAVDEAQQAIEQVFIDVGVTDYVVAVRIDNRDFTMQHGSPFWMIGATTALMRRAAEVYQGSEEEKQ